MNCYKTKVFSGHRYSLIYDQFFISFTTLNRYCKNPEYDRPTIFFPAANFKNETIYRKFHPSKSKAFNLTTMQKFFFVKNIIFGYPLLDQDQSPSFSYTVMNHHLNNSIEFKCTVCALDNLGVKKILGPLKSPVYIAIKIIALSNPGS